MDESRKALVFIIESPNARDLVEGNLEGRLLSESLRLDKINQQYFLATDVEVFRSLLEYFKVLASEQKVNTPILHLSMHASEKGIAFTNHRMMKWGTLADTLIPLNQACGGRLLLSLSCCMGSWINIELIHNDKEMPFKAAISASGKILWNDAAIAFVVFYHQYINKYYKLPDAVDAMNDASATDPLFLHWYGRKTRDSLIRYFSHVTVKPKSTT